MKGISKLLFMIILARSLLADTIIIPDPSASIQAGIDAALDGDTVLVGPGLYDEQLIISDKNITLASNYILSQDTAFISNTILEGNNRAFVIRIESTAGPGTSIIGFTIQNGTDGIYPLAPFNLMNNRITDCSDGVDYETGSGGICRDNVFDDNSDDGIDLDGAVDIIIENNNIINNGDDGIEIRLHEYSGSLLNITIQNNLISGNEEDGIQLIDYPDISDRIFYIYNNLIINNFMAGIGCMSDGNTTEDYEGASIIETIYLINNTIYGNEYGVTGGDNLIAKNNIIANCTVTAMKNVDNNSLISYSSFWNNGVNFDNCNIYEQSLVYGDPGFVDTTVNDFHLTYLSACIDIGDPLSPSDPDSTRADAGSFYYHQSLSDFSLIHPGPESLIETLQPDFSWEPSLADGEEPISYDLYYTDDPLLPDSLATIVQNITGLTFTLSDTVNNFTEYNWKVLAKNPWSLQKWSSESWAFSVNTDSVSPVINSDLPALNYSEDDSLSILNSFWYPFIDDDATPDSSLRFQYTQGSNITIFSKGDTNVFKSESNWFGTDTLQLSVTDLGDSTSSAPFIVSVNPINDPPEFNNLPDSLIFFADSSTGINLWDYITDIESADSLLTWDFNSSPDSLIIDFQTSTGQLTVSSQGYIGIVELLITVTDDSNATVSDTINVYSILRDINPPQIIEPLPTITFSEDDSIFVMDSFWYPYVSDEDTEDSLLSYNISGEKRVTVINYGDSHLIKAGLNWFGMDTLQLSVSEPGNLQSMSSFIVSVNPVNDIPQFHEIPDSLSFFADSSIGLDLWEYVADIESPDSLLTFEFELSPDSLLLSYQISSGWLSMSSSGYIGTVALLITVTDDSNAAAAHTIYITAKDPDINPPQFVEPLPLITFNEDDSVFVTNSFWYPYVSDEETADSLLTYTISDGKNISVISLGDSNLFKAAVNWFGDDTLRLSVTDRENLMSTSPFIVSVNPINDPPRILDLPDSLTIDYQSSYSFNLWDLVEDVETEDSLLTYNFWFSIDSILINYEERTGQIELTLLGNIASTTFYIEVADDSNSIAIDSILINIKKSAGLEQIPEGTIPDDFVLNQNYPNPFNPVTTIRIGLPEANNIKIEIYDVIGKKLLTLYEGYKSAGYHNLVWDANNFSSGVYIYRLSARGKNKSEMIKKMLLLK